MCGPFSTSSTAKHKYYVIFVDDYFCKYWLFFLMQKKDQTFTKFCEVKALVEKEYGKKVKALRSDNGGEYVSNEFKNLCASKGLNESS